jgi:hypothetical protein
MILGIDLYSIKSMAGCFGLMLRLENLKIDGIEIAPSHPTLSKTDPLLVVDAITCTVPANVDISVQI